MNTIQYDIQFNRQAKCLYCPRLGETCCGPNPFALGVDALCDWCVKLKRIKHITNEDIAEIAGVSLGTVENLMAKKIKDIRLTTAAAILRALVGSMDNWPCYLELAEYAEDAAGEHNRVVAELENATVQLMNMQAELARAQAAYAKELDVIREEYHKNVEFIKGELTKRERDIEYLKSESLKKDKIIDKLLDR